MSATTTRAEVVDYYGDTHAVPGPWHTLDQIKRANAASGHHFFDADTLRFFRSRIAPGVIAGRIIITSEQDNAPYTEPANRAWGGERRYTLRVVADDGTLSDLGPEGEDTFGAFATLDQARRWARRYLDGKEHGAIASWVKRSTEGTCRHCGRRIVVDDGRWVDPEATGDDSVWRETCDAHDTFTAEHEPRR